MFRISLLTIFIILLSLCNLTAQTKVKLPENKYNDNYNFKDIPNGLNEIKKATIVSYHKTTFTNNNFATNLVNKEITNYGGIELTMREFKWLPVCIEYGGFWDFYKTPTIPELYQLGAKLSVSTLLFPTPKIFTPYMGLGYQVSLLSVGETSQLNTSAPFWKVGAQSVVGQGFVLNFEYSQSFLVPNRSFNQLSIGVGVAF